MKPISDHVRNFEGADVVVIAISIDAPQSFMREMVTSGTLGQTLGKVIQDHARRHVVALPASDGQMFLLDSNSSLPSKEGESQSLSAAVSAVRAKLRELSARDGAKFDVQVVNKRKSADISHVDFIALKQEDRYQRVLSLIKNVKMPDLLFLRSLTSDLSEQSVLYAQPAAMTAFDDIEMGVAHDKRYETNPLQLALDIYVIRGVCEQMNWRFERGEVVPQYCPLNFNTMKDGRYWPIYEIEIRNIPSFFTPFIRWEIVNVPPGTPVSTMSQVVDRLKGFGAHVSLCQAGHEATFRNGHDLVLPAVSELSFFVPSGLHERDWQKTVLSMRNYASRGASGSIPIGIRNLSAKAQLPPKLLRGSVFLSQPDSKRMHLVASETAYVS